MHLHELVDLAGGLDEARDEAVLLRPVGRDADNEDVAPAESFGI